MRTYVYIDGFNLYHGLRHTGLKWLNVRQLCENMVKDHQIETIKYFTAMVKARPGDPDQPNRQKTYLRAIRTIPKLEIVLGSFFKHVQRYPIANVCKLATPGQFPPKMVKVVMSKEKASDVNLASHLLLDAFKKRYELAILITNDSDLTEPVRMVRREFGLPVGILNPKEHHSKKLKTQASFLMRIRNSDLRAAQFPTTLRDSKGEFHKPSAW